MAEPVSVDSKAVRLARYLKEFVGLRSTTVRDVSDYESVLWFGDMPQEAGCQSPAWLDGVDQGEPWLRVHKQEFPKAPAAPDIVLPWVDQLALKRADNEIPALRSTTMMPDPAAVVENNEQVPLVAHSISDHPEVVRAYENFKPIWEAWSAEYRRRERVQTVYADLFRLHTQVQKQGEIVELVLGLGLLAWKSPVKGKSVPVIRHVVTARVDLHFDPSSGVIRVEGAADGVRLSIEDDMLEAELRPERSHYASVQQQLDNIDDAIWDRPRIFAALKYWAGALDPSTEWFPGLKAPVAGEGKPTVSFAPALILRRRNERGMTRIYDAIITRLSDESEGVPPGWAGLLEDDDDYDDIDAEAPADPSREAPKPLPTETYFPLPANREQQRIVDAIEHRRGVLVQGPPGTGKSHTIANLICHLLATGKRVLVTAETGHALRVLKAKLPKEIQPLCVSLLGQGGDAFAELNAAVQGITARHAVWSRGAHDGRIAEISRELDAARRARAKVDHELRTLREGETYSQSLIGGVYEGTPSVIAERVSSEREGFGWLQLPRDANEEPPVNDNELLDWLRIRRAYNEDEIAAAKLQILSSDNIPTPSEFASSVASEHEAKQVLDRLAELRRLPEYRTLAALDADERAKLAATLRSLRERRRTFDRTNYPWSQNLLAESLEGRNGRWQALSGLTKAALAQIEQLVLELRSHSVSISTDREVIAVLTDAVALLEHFESGGKWKSLGLLPPRAVRGRTYIREDASVDGHPADNAARLRALCNYLRLRLAFAKLEDAWGDIGGVPKGTDAAIRLAATNELASSLEQGLQYARDCLELGRSLVNRCAGFSEPDWLHKPEEKLLDVLEACEREQLCRVATARVEVGLTRHGTNRAFMTLILSSPRWSDRSNSAISPVIARLTIS